jgi:ABC-type lipoprotein export system ATPase subunit
VILADEPTGNLDDASSAGIHELMGQLARDERKTFVVVTHKRDFADYAHRVALLSDGVLRQIRGTDASDV